MFTANKNGQFEIKDLPIIGPYNRQRFAQWSSEDTANFYMVKDDRTKENVALYPVMGRAHIRYAGINRLAFNTEPRVMFKTINYAYIVEGNTIFQYDAQYNQRILTGLLTIAGELYFSFLVVNNIVYAIFVDSQKIYIYQEGTAALQPVTDPLAPGNFMINGQVTKPGFIVTFGNRIAVSVANSSQFVLSAINLSGNGATNPPGYNFDPAKVFTNFGTTPQVSALENGIIRQMGVLNNTLYIFTDYTTGVWSNIPAIFSGTGITFPWKKSSTYDWNFGIANSTSLDIDFGIMVFLAQNSNGLLQFMVSNGDQPKRLSTKAIDTLLQRYTNLLGSNNPFLVANSAGFLYEYEDTIFYRFSGGPYTGTGILDQEQESESIEYSFEVGDWHRTIELNGERNRISDHLYFNYKHLVTLVGDGTVYNMSGQYYYNEVSNPDQPDQQAIDAYLAYPFRYERITPILYLKDYAEFEDEYVQIDFVFGDSNINYSTAPFQNAQFLIAEQLRDEQIQYIVAEQPDSDGQPIFILANRGNTPQVTDLTYNYLFNPHIELYFSNDGGKSYHSADVREFSQMGVYTWRMRWYQLGPSRNRVYKLICVSMVPIVVLGGVRNTRRMSGGAN
jgi:hypothetical protein